MPGSGAGLNRVGQAGAVALVCNPSSTANTLAYYLQNYGNAGNDSYVLNGNSPNFVEAAGFSKIQCELIPYAGSTTYSGYSIAVLGTSDPRAYAQYKAQMNPMTYAFTVGGTPTVPPGSWKLLTGPSDQGGEGVEANPMTQASPMFYTSRGLLAVRFVLVAMSAASGAVAATYLAVP